MTERGQAKVKYKNAKIANTPTADDEIVQHGASLEKKRGIIKKVEEKNVENRKSTKRNMRLIYFCTKTTKQQKL